MRRLDRGARAQLDDPPADDVVRRRQRDDHLAPPYFAHHSAAHRSDPSTLTVAQESRALLAGVVVEQPTTPLPAAREVIDEPRAGVVGTDDQHRLAQRLEQAVQAMLLPRGTRSGCRP